jgi:tetratricopeptide (TPR) repeat protein
MKVFLSAFLYLATVAVLTTSAYRTIRSDWIIYRGGEHLYAKKEYSAAVPVYEKLLSKSFRPPALMTHLADSYLATGRNNDAIAVTRLAYETEPLQSRTMTLLADVFVKYGLFSDAADILRKALKISPHDRTTRIKLARALTWTGNFDEAIIEYKEVLEGNK